MQLPKMGRLNGRRSEATCLVPAAPAAGSAAAPAKEDVVATTMLRMYGEVATKICACADKACADAAKAEGDQIETDARESGIQPTPEQATQFEKTEATINECANKFP